MLCYFCLYIINYFEKARRGTGVNPSLTPTIRVNLGLDLCVGKLEVFLLKVVSSAEILITCFWGILGMVRGKKGPRKKGT